MHLPNLPWDSLSCVISREPPHPSGALGISLGRSFPMLPSSRSCRWHLFATLPPAPSCIYLRAAVVSVLPGLDAEGTGFLLGPLSSLGRDLETPQNTNPQAEFGLRDLQDSVPKPPGLAGIRLLPSHLHPLMDSYSSYGFKAHVP